MSEPQKKGLTLAEERLKSSQLAPSDFGEGEKKGLQREKNKGLQEGQ